jgi:hypothetical protein
VQKDVRKCKRMSLDILRLLLLFLPAGSKRAFIS